ncbi:MAG: hypothetical protein GY953_07980 [bacterium]|nr:hypothetical protein [bacterium]
MGLELSHLVYALVIAVIAYVAREIHRWRHTVRPRTPHMTMEEAWESFQPTAPNPDRELTEVSVFPDRILAEVKQGVLDAERQSEEAPSARLAIRGFILSNAAISLHLEAIAQGEEEARKALIKGYEPGMDLLLNDAVAGATLKWLVLRHYARWKFDDAVGNDWFHQYMGLARPYVREKVRLAQAYVVSVDESVGRFAEIYDKLLAELGESALKARQKKRFVPPDLPWQ